MNSSIDSGSIDPITVEIIQSSLQAISDEMFATMRKTAMSSIIYEVLDFGVCVTDAKGELASSGSGIPAFVGMLDWGIKAVLAKHNKQGDILSGDVFDNGVARHALERGGHLRVGLEDYAGPRTPSNEEMVEAAVQLVREVGRPLATPAEAAKILDLPR